MERVGGAVEERSGVVAAVPRRGSWARRVLLAMCATHAVALSVFHPMPSSAFWLLLGLNALAIAGLLSRTRAGWFAALLFVLASGVRWTGVGIEETSGLLPLLALAAAVFCVTDPSLRREHGIAG